jgi:hypothetical protein
VTLTTHVVSPTPAQLTDVSPLVFDRRSRSVYVGLSLGRGRHYRVYNLMQRHAALTAAVADEAHGYYRPDGTFQWYEYFYVPNRLEEHDIRASIEALGVPPVPPVAARPHRERLRGAISRARQRFRPVRAAARRAKERARRVTLLVHAPRPPCASPERVADLSRVEPDDSFISGNLYASRCRYVLNYDVLSVNEAIENDWWFCKSDWLEYFFRELAPDSPFVLFTANSDRTIGRKFVRHLQRPNFVAWFAVNAAFSHPRLFAIPLGIGDPNSVHGHAGGDLRAVQRRQVPKTRLMEVSFDVKTNPTERLRCLEKTGLELDPPAAKPEYLERIASSYFCVAPRGNGIDTHRLWEALYLQTVPVVTRSLLADQHPDLPLVVLDDWGEFKSIDFSPELYAATWGDWSPAALTLDGYLRRIARALEAIRTRSTS